MRSIILWPLFFWLQTSWVLFRCVYIYIYIYFFFPPFLKNSFSFRVFLFLEIKWRPVGDYTQSFSRSSEGWPERETSSTTREYEAERQRGNTACGTARLLPLFSRVPPSHISVYTCHRSRLDYVNTFANKKPFFLQHYFKNSYST